MRLTSSRGRALSVCAGVVYVALLAWLMSPVWDAPAERSLGATEAPASPSRPLAIVPIAPSKALPDELPDPPAVAAASAAATAAGDAGADSAQSSGFSTSSGGSNPVPASGGSEPESSSPSKTIIDFDG